ncbi:MAG: hypothetical protein PHX48_05540 [Bacteroidales bacterium]|nr:hypothetical protein [Bacteroidales bacterium]
MKTIIINKTLAYYTIFIFLCVPSLTKGQDFKPVAEDKILMSKDYEKLILNYERIIFLSQDNKQKNQALLQKANVFKEMNDFDRASRTLERVQEYELNEIELKEYYYQKIFIYYLNGNFSKAASTIETMYLSLDSSSISHTLLIQSLVYNELNEYSKAKQKAIRYLEQSNKSEIIPIIDSIYRHKPKLKSEKTAKYLSFFPGLGHIYAGYWSEGIVSFLLNAGVLVFGGYEVITKNYITAYLGAGGILSGLYFGSYERGLHLTKKRNYINTKAFNSNIKEVMLR